MKNTPSALQILSGSPLDTAPAGQPLPWLPIASVGFTRFLTLFRWEITFELFYRLLFSLPVIYVIFTYSAAWGCRLSIFIAE